jgi:uncharacterized protein
VLQRFVLVCWCLALAGPAQAAGLPAYPFIHVTGKGFATVIPDRGLIDFEIAAQDVDPQVALATVNTRVGEIRALMAEAGLAESDIEIRDVRRVLRHADGNGAPVHDLRCGVRLQVNDLGKWRAVIGPLLDRPNLDGFMTVFDSTDRTRVENDLMRDAIASARLKAESIAAGLGRKLGPVSAISTEELKNLTRAMKLSPVEFGRHGGGDEAQDRADLLTVTSLKMAQSVDVIYRMRP